MADAEQEMDAEDAAPVAALAAVAAPAAARCVVVVLSLIHI